jgi:hypothetical protein
MEETATIAPPPVIAAAAERRVRSTPVRSTSSRRCQRSSLSSARAALSRAPALATTRSSRPKWSWAASVKASTEAGSVTSQATATALPPAASASATA